MISSVGLLVAAGVFAFFVTASDDGINATVFGQAAALAALFAAGPVAALLGEITPERILIIGGGMTIVGIATTPGGNLLGPVMAFVGVAYLLAGAAERPAVTPRTIGLLLIWSILLWTGALLAFSIGV